MCMFILLFWGYFTLFWIPVSLNTLISMQAVLPVLLYSTQGFLLSILFSYSLKNNSFTEIMLHTMKNESTASQHQKFMHK